MKQVFTKAACSLTFSLISISLVAQFGIGPDRKEQYEIFRKEIWGWKKPEFEVRTIPAEYAQVSSVVIARHVEISGDSKKKNSGGNVFATTTFRQIFLNEIAREAVRINDKSAVKDYSEIAFTRSETSYSGNFTKTTDTYIGVRIIKPDGSVKEVSLNDMVVTGDKAKLAIPELEVGDIIDHFVAKRTRTDQIPARDGSNNTFVKDVSNYTFALSDDAPIMYTSIHIEMEDQYAIEYRSYNGAPDFKRSTNGNKDIVFDLVLKNIPAYTESGLWTSSLRQLPVIRMNIKMGSKNNQKGWANPREPGKVYFNPAATEFIDDEKIAMSEIKNYRKQQMYSVKQVISGRLKGNISDHYSRISKNKENLPVESIAAELYYLYRYAMFLRVTPNMEIADVIGTLKKPVDLNAHMYDLGSLLREKDMECEMVFVTPRSGPYLNEIIRSEDISWMLLAKENKESKGSLLGMSDIFSPAFFIPSEYENTDKAITMRIEGPRTDYVQGIINIPGTPSSQNARIELLNITQSANGTDLQVSRRTVLKGHYKPDVQKKLVLFEDFCNSERKLFGEQTTMIEELEENKQRKSYAPELKAAFDKERVKQKDEFISEAKEWLDQPIADLTDYKVENPGVRHNKPDLIYSSKFTLSGLIKKAGNNMIIDIGKLQGTPLTITPGQRKRRLDVNMPFARSLQVQVNLQIPDGYTAEGVNELNKKVENETGYFITEATSDGKSVTVNIKKSYNHAFEPVGNWEKLLAFIDAANEWSNAKILLKKK